MGDFANVQVPIKPAVRVKNLSHAYYDPSSKKALVVLDRFNFSIQPGEFVCLVGPSGCGKSSLLRLLAGLEPVLSGVVDTGSKLPAVVFQENSLFPWLSVEKNITYSLEVCKVPRREWEARVERLISLLGLEDFRHVLPHQLSGGMKQRVSVARALAADRPILLMDEPFGALDEQTRFTLQQELLRIWEKTRKTVLFITHSVEEALVLADRVVVMSGRPGQVLREITNPLARPRLVVELRRQSAFVELAYDIWQLLEQKSGQPKEYL